MPFLVEQVDIDGNFVVDYDKSLSVAKIYAYLKEYFPNIHKDSEGMICGEVGSNKYSIRIKNVTYLGNPHPQYKKRIQIPEDLQKFFSKSLNQGMKPLLLGIYTYGENVLFCAFNIEDFINKKAHNSSAHVYTSDLYAATVDLYFQKVDYFGNHITVFAPNAVNTFLTEMFSDKINKTLDISNDGEHAFSTEVDYTVKNNSQPGQISCFQNKPFATHIIRYINSFFPEKILSHICEFFYNEDKTWNGVECYKEMIQGNYNNKFQPEWAGFYLEFKFNNYIHNNNLTDEIKYAQDKKKGGVDLDLFFPSIKAYGDLKAHSEDSRGIQGNDLITIRSIIHSNKYANHIYYVVCEHSTRKDSECGYTVTEYWNKIQNKANLMSYSKKMKNAVELKKIYILDINEQNEKYLSVFKQGINSNGKPREPKIMIEHDNLKYFSIFEMNL